MSASPVSRRRGRPKGVRTRLPLALDARLAVRTDEAAALVDPGISKMKMWIADGTVESVKIGSMRLVKVASLKRLVGV